MAVAFDVFVAFAEKNVVVTGIGVVVKNIVVVCLKSVLPVDVTGVDVAGEDVAGNMAIGGNVVASIIGRVCVVDVVVVRFSLALEPRKAVLLCVEYVLPRVLSSENLSKLQLRILC